MMPVLFIAQCHFKRLFNPFRMPSRLVTRTDNAMTVNAVTVTSVTTKKGMFALRGAKTGGHVTTV